MAKKYFYLLLIILSSCSKNERVAYNYYNTGEVQRKILYTDRSDTTSFNAQYYYKNGKLEIESKFIHGKREGEYKKYFENGNVQENYYYLHGLKHGVFQLFNNNGELITENYYYQGNLILRMVAQVSIEDKMTRHVFYKVLNDSTLSEVGVLVFRDGGNVFEDASFFYDVFDVDTVLSQLKIRFYNKKDDYLLSLEGGEINDKGLFIQSGLKAETNSKVLIINFPKEVSILTGILYLKKDTDIIDFPFFKKIK